MMSPGDMPTAGDSALAEASDNARKARSLEARVTALEGMTKGPTVTAGTGQHHPQPFPSVSFFPPMTYDDLLHRAYMLIDGEDATDGLQIARLFVDAGWRPAHELLTMMAEIRTEGAYEDDPGWTPIDEGLRVLGYDMPEVKPPPPPVDERDPHTGWLISRDPHALPPGADEALPVTFWTDEAPTAMRPGDTWRRDYRPGWTPS